MEKVEEGCGWGTWEELLLGGAVLRHGTHDWDVVAAELRARTVSPFITFTPEVCKAKYEDLQQRYSGCKAWFGELRKKRIAELRQALEVSEDSIGSLETKLEILNSEQKCDSPVSYDSSRTESGIPCQKCDGVESSSKETSKDGLSAGSFTQETRANWSPVCQIPTSTPAEEIENRPEVLVSPKQENTLTRPNVEESAAIGSRGMLKGRRGKRKRKYIIKDVKEGSVGETVFGSADVLSATQCKENSASNSGQNAGSSHVDRCRASNTDKINDLMAIFTTLAENKCASVFHRRLDSQKRGRYKKMIMQHLDFETIRSRIASCCITSAKEVYRDLLLLANNALVFYSKTTREYKSALLLREIVTKSLKQHLKDYISRTTIALLSSTLPSLNPPVKPRSARPNNHRKLLGKAKKDGKVASKAPSPGKRVSIAEPLPSAEPLSVKKKGPGRTKKGGRVGSSQLPENPPSKGRKRSRTK